LGHFLKKSAVQDLEPVIQENTQALCKHFSAAAKKKSILELYAVFHCFTSDTLSQHAFGRDIGFHHLDELELSDTWKTQVNTMFEFCRPIRHFNFMGDIAHLIPRQLATVLPPYAHVYAMEQVRQNYYCLCSGICLLIMILLLERQISNSNTGGPV
jgi:hypothetical protein